MPMRPRHALLSYAAAALLSGACSSHERPTSQEGRTAHQEAGLGTTAAAASAKQPRRSPVIHQVAALALPPAPSGAAGFVPRRYVAGDGAVAVELPAPFPGSIALVTADQRVATLAGQLAADAPLRFTSEAGELKAESFDGKLVYRAAERVTSAGAWTAAAGPTSGCCGWWEHTLWRADARQPGAGLLRAVTAPGLDWSVVDFHDAGASSTKPRWRLSLTSAGGKTASAGGKTAVVAAAVAPGANRAALVVADKTGAAAVQGLDAADGKVRWTTALTTPAAQWRKAGGQLAYSEDGAHLAVLVESPERCETCSAIELLDAASGEPRRRIELAAVVSPQHSRLGFTGGAVWLFEHVPARANEQAARPRRSQYEAYDLASGARRPAPSADWSFEQGKVWGLSPAVGAPGVVALGWRDDGKLLWLRADAAP